MQEYHLIFSFVLMASKSQFDILYQYLQLRKLHHNWETMSVRFKSSASKAPEK